MLQILIMTGILYGLPDHLLPAICWVESRHNEKAINPKDPSYGLCQIKQETASWIMKKHITIDELMDGQINAMIAAKYLKHLSKRYKGDLKCIIKAYNSGSCSAANNEAYLIKVLGKMKLYSLE